MDEKQLNRIEDSIRLLSKMQIALMEEITRSRFVKNVEEWKKEVEDQIQRDHE